MSAPTGPVATQVPATLLQSSAAFDSLPGQVFLGLVAFLVVLLVARVVMSVAWKLALIAAVVVGAFLFVTAFLPI